MGTMNYCELVAEPCPNQLHPRLDTVPQFPTREVPSCPWSHLGFDFSCVHEEW